MNLQLTLEHHEFELCRYIYTWIFSTNIQSALLIPGFCICRFNQPWVKNSIFDSQLRIHRYRGLNTIIHRFSTVWGVGAPNSYIVQGLTVQFKSRPLKACRRKRLNTSLFPDDTGPCFCLSARFGWVLIWRVCRGCCFEMAWGCTALCA